MRPGLLRHLLAPLCLGFLPLAAQELKPGAPAPALPIDKWLAGKPLAAFAPGQVYIVEFWESALELGVQRAKDYAALQQKHGGKLAIVGVARDGEDIDLHVAEAFYAQHGGGIDYRIGWDEGGKAHAAWLGGAGREAPAVFVVDGKGALVWSGAFAWLELVLPPTLAGKADPVALAEQVDKLDKRFTRIFVAAALKPQVAIEEMDKLLAEQAFLAPYLLPGVYSTMVGEKHAEFAARLAPRVADLGIRLGDVQMLNSLAWSIVDPEVESEKRDLATAERAAAKAVELTKEADPNVLDTLARVWFWKKDYAQAVAWQQKAVDKCEPGEDHDLLVGTLKTYQELAAKK
jgi:hypothetical protein